MGLDLTISTKPCRTCGHVQVEENFGYTYNAAKMWYTVYPEDEGMVSIEGLTGKEAEQKLRKVIKEMITREEFFKKLEPFNGWGSYSGFLIFLQNLLNASIMYPKGMWEADR